MDSFQRIRIEGIEYFIVDSIQDLRAEDSFIHNRNKLAIFTGSGEARKYVGSYKGSSSERLSIFFEYRGWGKSHENGIRTYPTIQDKTCFFSKSNLSKYLYDARVEYQNQEQVYNNDISAYYTERVDAVNGLESDKVFFSIHDVSDLEGKGSSRAYIRSEDAIWSLWRKLILPKISYLSILKLVPTATQAISSKPLFFFRIILDYKFRSIVHPKLFDSEEVKIQRSRIDPTARQGAEAYRKEVIDHMPQCPFTKISDERLLIASHIKPYRVCMKEGRSDQASDYLNGLALTPTYDKLFDQGYITFQDNGELVCGTLLTPYTWERLNINPSAKNRLRIYPENRSEYLKYHREFVFQDNVEDLL